MDNAELRKRASGSTGIILYESDVLRLLDDSDELARLKAGPPYKMFLAELLADVETQRDTSADGSYSTRLDPVDRQHYRSRASSMAYVAERIRYFLETPAKEEEQSK